MLVRLMWTKTARFRWFVVILGATAVAVSLAAGCSHGSGGGASLTAAIGSVADGAGSNYFEWSDLARIRELGGVTRERPIGEHDTDHRRWASLYGTGAGRLREAAHEAAGVVDLYQARDALQVGLPPATAVRVDGVDAGRARDALVGYGGDKGKVAGHDGVISAGDNEIKLDSRLTELGVLNSFNKVAFDGDRMAFGPAEGAVGEALGAGDRKLADRAPYGDTARCLGDVIAATIAAAESVGVPSGVGVVGLGVRNPAAGSDPAHEVICLAAPDKAAADAVERRVRQRASLSARSATTGQAWSNLLSGLTVSRAGERVVAIEVTDLPDRPAGLLFHAFASRDLGGLTGA